ncbi:glycosyl hydrolase family 35 [Colletotrichum orchidophilum]|uniref:Beta-galactosidase n=1 Tax=Colletotrichum orchidophilum TaxID=1209926 RepID=A0A1G4B5L7_9PEZI|nr:glycosyl hydrolase family 35 [Colletotrichum orchidophilum]OHE96603.1 glycosyl hydrolase family 35 [Colletotrichum orchidophilum]
MRLSLFSIASLGIGFWTAVSAGLVGGRPPTVIIKDEKRDQLQDIVTWDEHSLFVRGERVMIFSGEIHPFRLPVPSLYLDIFQKVKALGLNTVSFYVNWALLEGKAGEFTAEGVYDLKPFFDAATKAGIYLIARPGPYINAEVSGGGFPGWLARLRAKLRTSDPEFLSATDNYMAKICGIIAKAQITNGGPVILLQPENEYTNFENGSSPDGKYFQYVIDQARKAGVVVPLISNDARPLGHNAPGTGTNICIQGHDGYPLGFDCANPNTWPGGKLPTNYHALHLQQSPSTPYSILEFQGGSFDPYGGPGFEKCAALLNHEFERVFYKNNFGAGVTIFNVYMIFGGTNWGNLGHPGGYTSYDYGAAITEERSVAREKYSELKLEAQFLKVSPAYLTTTPGNLTVGVYSATPDITVTPLLGNGNGSFFVVRHSNYSSLATTDYTLRLPTSQGTITIPQSRDLLQLTRRDSKFVVTDYPVGETILLYSTAEILTWKHFKNQTVLVVYSGLGETHEIAIKSTVTPFLIEGTSVDHNYVNKTLLLAWETSSTRRVVKVDNLVIYILDRNSAYNYWVPDKPGGSQPAYGTSIMKPDSLIINGGYLIRSISIQGDTLRVQADFNRTVELEIIGIEPEVTRLEVNGKQLDHTTNNLTNWIAKPSLADGTLSLPDLKSLNWSSIDSLPEIRAGYDDSAWPLADHKTTNNTIANLTTPVSLFASDYGFHAGTLVFRGYFTSKGTENMLNITTQGGSAFASSIWLNETFLGSFANGPDASGDNNSNYTMTNLTAGATYVLTILVDTTGLEENFNIPADMMKNPRGIMDYIITSPSGAQTNVTTWKVTGNLGGEDYADRFRGPLNEGGLFIERQGYHLPSPPESALNTKRSPFDGADAPGVAFYAAKLDLHVPATDLDVPLAFLFDDIVASSNGTGAYRAILYVNGFQYGRYVSNIGPQTRFPVPEGILRYQGTNYIGLAVWALEKGGARVQNFRLDVGEVVTTGREEVKVVEAPGWSRRAGAY